MPETMGIIKNVGIGLRDTNHPCMWFNVYTSDCLASLQMFSWDEAAKIIKDADVYSVNDLEGHGCYMEGDNVGGGIIKFVRVAKFGG